MCQTSTYSSWQSMKYRCLDPKAERYAAYGGRGISICERWLHSFPNFLADLGERPPCTTLDRMDVNGNYEPGNVRWATRAEQDSNKRRTPMFKLTPESVAAIHTAIDAGETQYAIAKRMGVSRSLVGAVKREESSAYRK